MSDTPERSSMLADARLVDGHRAVDGEHRCEVSVVSAGLAEAANGFGTVGDVDGKRMSTALEFTEIHCCA